MVGDKVFLDTNILMELLFRRSQYEVALTSVMALPEQTITCTSVLSIATLFYFVESEGFDKSIAHNFIKGYQLLAMNNEDYKWAEANDQGDFEDALQVACAKRNDCAYLLTLDKKLGKMYGKYLPVQTPKNIS